MAKNLAASPTPDSETEQRILEAATKVFIRRGTAGARMQEIAEEAGVNQALLHYYFRSKERLSDAVFRETAGRMFPVIIEVLGADVTIEEKIDSIVGAYLTAMSRTPFLPGYIISELHHHPGRALQLFGNVGGTDLAVALRPALARLEKQLVTEARAGRMRRITGAQFIVNLLSLCVYPFAARPMLRVALGLDDEQFSEFIDQRRKDLPLFIRSAMKP